MASVDLVRLDSLRLTYGRAQTRYATLTDEMRAASREVVALGRDVALQSLLGEDIEPAEGDPVAAERIAVAQRRLDRLHAEFDAAGRELRDWTAYMARVEALARRHGA